MVNLGQNILELHEASLWVIEIRPILVVVNLVVIETPFGQAYND